METDPKTKRIAIAIGALVAALTAGVLVLAVVQQHRIEQTPGAFPRPEPPAVRARAPWPPRFGVEANVVAASQDAAFRERQFRAIARGGLRWIRVPIEWSRVQPSRDDPPDFGHTDDVVRDATTAGLALEVELVFTPQWASTLAGSDRTPAKHPADTDRFVRAVVARYGPHGAFWSENAELRARPVRVWEIWNEPNVRHFFAPRSGRTYAHHAVVVARAIRSVDPEARILFGGLSGHLDTSWEVAGADNFLADALHAQPTLKRLLDAVAIHSYGDAAEVAHVTCEMRLAMDRLGLRTKPLVLNEFGWHTSGDGALTDAERARWIGEIVAVMVKPDRCPRPRDAVLIAPYTWWTQRKDAGNKEQWYGLADDLGRPFASGATYEKAVAGADRAYPRPPT